MMMRIEEDDVVGGGRLSSEQMNDKLILIPSIADIKETLDGMIYAWNIIQQDLLEAVWDFFHGFQLPKAWTATIPVLILKSPEANLRPISLCSVCHKITARILGDILPSIISQEQAGFVKGRSIHENMALAHDLTYDLHKKGKGNNILIKLDMSK